MPSYDLAVAYRIYPRIAEAARGLPFSHDKYKLADICLRSFRDSLGGLRVKMWVLADGCSPEYVDLFSSCFDPRSITVLSLDQIGNRATFAKQIDILLMQNSAEAVYFAEDDYYYLPNQFHLMLQFMQAHPDVDFVTPYDHLDCYTLALHNRPEWLRVFGEHHWRTAASTCLTFLTTRRRLSETESVFRSYCRGNYDASLWLSLTKQAVFSPAALMRGPERHHMARVMAKTWLYGWRQVLAGKKRRLWVPVPGIATHLCASALSPGIDWRALMLEASRSQANSGEISTKNANAVNV
jgi:hypothetical protein